MKILVLIQSGRAGGKSFLARALKQFFVQHFMPLPIDVQVEMLSTHDEATFDAARAPLETKGVGGWFVEEKGERKHDADNPLTKKGHYVGED